MKTEKKFAFFALFTLLSAVLLFYIYSYASVSEKPLLSGKVCINGDAKVGNVLTAELSGVSPEGATVEVTWIVDGESTRLSGRSTVLLGKQS